LTTQKKGLKRGNFPNNNIVEETGRERENGERAESKGTNRFTKDFTKKRGT